MEDLSLHILDIAENSIDSGATRVDIIIKEDLNSDRLTLRIDDNGNGMDEDMVKKASDPFFTSKRGKRCGLGIPLLAQAAKECNGDFSINSVVDRGTCIVAEFKITHIDRKPLGDIGTTMSALICGHPGIDYLFFYERDGFSYRLNTVELKANLDEVPINTPELLKCIKEDINEAIRTLAEQPGTD
jgi:anti-sigma regulatory factor (Ser/Thr protein kinase)